MRVPLGADRLAATISPPANDKGAARTGLTTLNRLHCFEVVVEEAGFKRATARLHITQPALSYQMKHLEEELGALLFHRRPGGVSLTDAGRLLFTHVQRVSAAVREAQRAVKDIPVAAAVRIGTVNSIGTYFLPQLLSTVRKRHAVTCTVELGGLAGEVIDALLSNRIDVAVLADPRVDRRLRYETLFEERVSLVAGRTHPFFGVATVRPEQLKDAQFVALSQQTPTGSLVRKYLDGLGLTVEPVVSTENVETLKRMVEIGLGVAFLPDMVTARDVATRGHPSGTLSRSTIDPPLTRRIVLVTANEVAGTPAITTFVDEVRRQGGAWRRVHGRANA